MPSSHTRSSLRCRKAFQLACMSADTSTMTTTTVSIGAFRKEGARRAAPGGERAIIPGKHKTTQNASKKRRRKRPEWRHSLPETIYIVLDARGAGRTVSRTRAGGRDGHDPHFLA